MTAFTLTDWVLVAPKTYVAVAQPEAVNIGLVLGTKHTLLIDTGSSPDQGAAIAESVESTFGRVIDRVIITHAHYDHWFGLCAFNAAKTYGQAQLLSEVSIGDDSAFAYQMGFSPELITPPQNLIREWGSFNLGGEHVQLRHFGPAHSNSDLVVYLPKQGLAFVGDLIEESGPPHFGADSTVGTWPGTIDQIIALVGPDAILIPGHGKPVGIQFAIKQRDDISQFYSTICDYHAQGFGLQEVLERVESNGTSAWPFDIATAREATICVYAELAQVPRLASNGWTPRLSS